MFDRVLMILEVLLLVWVVIQGEYVRFYEREVFRMNKDRFEERKKWRQDKQKQQLKKQAELKTNDSEKSMVLTSPNMIADAPNSMTGVKSVAGLLMLSDPPMLTTSTLL